MLIAAAHVAQYGVLGLAAYNLAVSLAGWTDPPSAPAAAGSHRFRVVVPAHDEAAVLGPLLEDLAAASGPAIRLDAWVIADRCADETAAVARRAHVRVDERRDGPPGKAAALAWHLERHPLETDEALVVLDADNRIPPHLFARFASGLESGHQVMQAYLDVANPDDSLLTLASALSYWAGNRMVQLARTNLGWSADLGGTGMCFAPGVLELVGGFGETVAEDQDVAGRLALAGIAVVWLHDARLLDEKPSDVRSAVNQRARWMVGKRSVARALAGRLVRKAIAERRLAPADHALRLVQPSRSMVALATGLLAVVAVVTRARLLLPWPVLVAGAALQVLAPVVFLAREKIPGRYLLRYPAALVLPALWPVVRLASRRSTGWYHTRHRGGGS